MATRTVSAAGGNFNATGTWVGGVAPIAGDDIIANATSGNLTLTANTVNLSGANFTGYTRTLSLVSFQFNLASAASVTLGASMSVTNTSSTGRIRFVGTGTLTSNGIRIPYLEWNSTLTLVGDVNVGDNSTTTAAITGANMIFYGSSIALNNMNFTGGAKLIIRPDSTITISSGANGMNGILQLDTTNTITTSSSFRLDNQASGNSLEITKPLTFSSASEPVLVFAKGLSSTSSINAGTYSIEFHQIIFAQGGSGIATLNINSPSISVRNIIAEGSIGASNNSFVNCVITGTNPFSSIGSIWCPSYTGGRGQIGFQRAGTIRLSSSFTYSVTGYLGIGGNGPLRSILGGTPSTTNLLFTGLTYSITNADLRDINFTSVNTPLYYLNNTGVTFSNMTGLSLPPSGGGGGGGSFTFVN